LGRGVGNQQNKRILQHPGQDVAGIKKADIGTTQKVIHRVNSKTNPR